MDSIALFREQYGITQSNLAIYLSVSISLLKMAEAGNRELPAAATLKMIQLQLFMHRHLAENAPASLLPDDLYRLSEKHHDRELKKYIRKSEIQIRKQQKELVLMEKRYRQALNRLQLIEYLLTADTTEGVVKDELWLQVAKADTREAIVKYAKPARQLLQWKIESSVYGVQKAKELLAEAF